MISGEKTRLGWGNVFGVSKEGLALYLTHFLRTFSLSLSGIYTPIFIFTLTDKPKLLDDIFTNNVAWVLLFCLSYALFVSLANIFLTDFLFRRLGFRRSILLSMFFLMMMIGIFVFAKSNFAAVFLASVFLGLAVHFYWIPFHVFFLRKANSGGNYGNEAASQVLIGTLAAAAGPVAAGAILSLFGFDVLFFLILFFLFISSLPVFFVVNDTRHGEHGPRKIFQEYILNPKLIKLNLAFIGNGIEGLVFDFLWPILLFVVLQDFLKLGGLVSFSTILSMLVVFWLGRLFESKRGNGLKKISTAVNAFLYLGRVFVRLPIGVLMIDIIDRFNGKIYGTALAAEIYDRSLSSSRSDSDFIIYRETISHLGQVFGLLLCLMALIILPQWQMVFFIPGLAAGLVYLIYT